MEHVTDLSERYGSPSATRTKALVALAVVVVGAGLSWLVWVMLVHGRPLVQSDITGFEVLDAHTTEASFTVVRRDAEVEASCLLRAVAGDHSIVGERDVVVGPGEPTTTAETETIRTEREATSVEVVGCVAEGQKQRR